MCLVLPLTSSLCPVCHLLMSLCVVKPVFFSPTRCQFICSASPRQSCLSSCSSCSCLCSSVFLWFFYLFLFVVFFALLNPGLLPILVPCYYPFFVVFLSVFAFCVVDVLPSSASLKASLFVLYPAGLLSVLRWVPHYFCYT